MKKLKGAKVLGSSTQKTVHGGILTGTPAHIGVHPEEGIACYCDGMYIGQVSHFQQCRTLC